VKYYCKNCGFRGRPFKFVPGSLLLEILLWLCFLLPGIIYTGLRRTKAYYGCPACRAPSMIPESSYLVPRINTQGPVQRSQFCGSCGQTLAPGATFCANCGARSIIAAEPAREGHVPGSPTPAPQQVDLTSARGVKPVMIGIAGASTIVFIFALIHGRYNPPATKTDERDANAGSHGNRPSAQRTNTNPDDRDQERERQAGDPKTAAVERLRNEYDEARSDIKVSYTNDVLTLHSPRFEGHSARARVGEEIRNDETRRSEWCAVGFRSVRIAAPGSVGERYDLGCR
jgi:predicted RNA-binding Zn-ribbon protein involved in translation (DUF1610 family)